MEETNIEKAKAIMEGVLPILTDANSKLIDLDLYKRSDEYNNTKEYRRLLSMRAKVTDLFIWIQEHCGDDIFRKENKEGAEHE